MILAENFAEWWKHKPSDSKSQWNSNKMKEKRTDAHIQNETVDCQRQREVLKRS